MKSRIRLVLQHSTAWPRIAGTALFCIALPRIACADGMFVWRNEQIDIHEPEQKAVIFWDGTHEDLVLSVKYEGAPEDFGWIVPLPADPQMSPDDPMLFEAMSMATQDRSKYTAREFRAMGLTIAGDVEVLRKERVGQYDSTVLRASDGAALQSWLRQHDYKLPRGAAPVLDRYAKLDWVFVAMKIAPDAADSTTAASLRSGTTHPIRFRFPSKAPVYPLEISSVLAQESDVLLYLVSPTPLVPQPIPGVTWAQMVRSYGASPWMFSEYFDRNPHRSAPGDTLPRCITKIQARIEPARMKDVTAVPWDVEKALRSDATLERFDAIDFLIHIPYPDAERLLVECLKRDLTNDEHRAALAGLQRRGTRKSEKIVARYAEHSDPETRFLAWDTLTAWKSRRILPIALEVLEDVSPTTQNTRNRMERDWTHDASIERAFDVLLENGDETCLARLRGLARKHSGFEAWKALALDDPWWWDPVDLPVLRTKERGGFGRRIVLAMSACGDREAQAAIQSALIVSSTVTREERIRDDATVSRREITSFPPSFWAGKTITQPMERCREWQAFAEADPDLAKRPNVRDAIFRAVALDNGVPDAGKVILLSRMTSLLPADVTMLQSIWMRALQAPSVAIPILESSEDTTIVPCKLTASLVMYAFARAKHAGGLRTIEKTAVADSVTRPDFAYAVATCADSGYSAPVINYIRDVWDPWFRSPELRAKMKARLTEERSRPLFALHAAKPDLGYREYAITRFLTGRVPVTEGVIPLMEERSLAPIHRLFWVEQCGPGQIAHPTLPREGLNRLRSIRKDVGKSDPFVTDIADDMIMHAAKMEEWWREREEDQAARAAGMVRD